MARSIKKGPYVDYSLLKKVEAVKALKQNLKIAKELIDILLHKKLAVESRMERFKQALNTHPNKVDAIESRYRILQEKLELELAEELAKLEQERLEAYHSYKQSKSKYEDIMYKLEQYKISDDNMR